MSDDRLAVEIRDAFERVHEPSPGLEHRVVAAIPWTEPRRRLFSAPRLAGALAGVLAIVMIGLLVTPSVINRLYATSPGSAPARDTPAYSLASVSASSVFVIQRNHGAHNLLLQSSNGGRTWNVRLRFDSVYDGMQMFGETGFIWSVDQNEPAVKNLRLYRTRDGGFTWSSLPAPDFAVKGPFFLDGSHGWIDSGSPAGGGYDSLYATADGGQTWNPVGALPDSSSLGWTFGVGNYRVTFSSVLRGWYLGNGGIFTTADGGHSWEPVVLPVPDVMTPSQPVFVGLDGVLPVAHRDPANLIYFYVTHDGGATWGDPKKAPQGFAPVGDGLVFAILDPQHIWLTSSSETAGDNAQASQAVARTSDGGLTWTVTKHTPRIFTMTFADPKHGFALDVTGPTYTNGILSTSDAGVTWHRVTVPVFT